MKYLKYIFAAIVFISLFLPWYGVSAESSGIKYGGKSYGDYSYSFNLDGFHTQEWGVLVLISLVAGVAFGFIQKMRKFEYIPFIACALFSLLPIFTTNTASTIFSAFGKSRGASAGTKYGLYISLIFSLVTAGYIYFENKKNKQTENITENKINENN